VTNDLGEGGVFGNDDLARCANHILGGARFGTDPKDSVLDKDCRAWGFDNLYVTDGASFPTSGGGNPTLKTQANSFPAADALKVRIGPMDPRFKDIAESPDNLIFQVVFFPDRIYHDAYLNATRSQRYRYNAQEVRGYL